MDDFSHYGRAYDALSLGDKDVRYVVDAFISKKLFEGELDGRRDREGLMFDILIWLAKSELVEFDFSDKSDLDFLILKKMFLEMYDFLEECIERLGFYIVLDENDSEIDSSIKCFQDEVRQYVRDITIEDLVLSYVDALYDEFSLESSWESALRLNNYENFDAVVALLAERIAGEDSDDYLAIVSGLFKKIFSECSLTFDEALFMKDKFENGFNVDLSVLIFELDLTKKEELLYIPPHHFRVKSHRKFSVGDVLVILEGLGGREFKFDSDRKYFQIPFEGGVFNYSFNVLHTRRGGLDPAKFINALKKHPNCLGLLSVDDARRISEEYRKCGVDLEY